MKKLIAVFMIFCVILCMCSCGSGSSASSYAKVTFSDGTSETLKVGEIPSLVEENKYAYNSKYAGNSIEVVTVVEDIGSSYGMAGFVPIYFKGGWNCYLKEDTPVIVDLRKGTNVKITGVLIDDSYSIQNVAITVIK